METIAIKPTHCPGCGKPLPAGVLEGLCPACLLAQGLASGSGDGGTGHRFEPPIPEVVAKLFPQLEILGLLGAGGMGAVYKARQLALDRLVALKILPAGGAHGADFAERFNREARALARLSHPNIVSVYEFGQVDGRHFFLMEFVDGTNLRQLGRTSRLSPREALQLIPQICDALQYAHDEGVVHRDIKPENVLVDRKGRVKIADFGLAKIMGQSPDSHRLTVEGQVMGTPHYMAPEQLERPLSVDHRADIYSLGVVFYELLTGDLPLGKFLPPSHKVQVDVRLDEIVLRALENDPARRYQHASEVKSGVETVSGSPGLETIAPAAARSSPLPSAAPPTATGAAVMSWWRVITPSFAAFVVWLLVVATTAFVTSMVPPKFRATARIVIDWPTNKNSVASAEVYDPYLFTTALKRILSDPVLEQAANRLKLAEKWAERSVSGRLSTRDAVDLLRSVIRVRQFQNTSLVQVEGWSESAVEAADLVNSVAEAFVEQSKLKRSAAVAGNSPTRLPEAEVIERAELPRRPSKPNVPLNLFLGLVGGGMLGIVAASFVGWRQRRTGVSGPARDTRRARLVIAAAVTLVLGVPFAVGFVANRAAQAAAQAERQRALAVAKAHELRLAQEARRASKSAEDANPVEVDLPPVVVGTQAESGAREQANQQRPHPLPSSIPAASAERWTPVLRPGEQADPIKVREEALALMQSGQYEEALQRYIWFHNHAVELKPSLSGVRLSFGLADWLELSRRYPKARQALLEVRDEKSRTLAEGQGHSDLFHDVAAINDYLQAEEATAVLFKRIHQIDPSLARQCIHYAKQALARGREYELYSSYIPDAQAEFASLRRDWNDGRKRAGPGSDGDSRRQATDQTFEQQVRQLTDVLAGAGRMAEAENIGTQAAALLKGTPLK